MTNLPKDERKHRLNKWLQFTRNAVVSKKYAIKSKFQCILSFFPQNK